VFSLQVVLCSVQVKLSFSKTQAEPGDHISLMVNAHQGSYIGILAVDQSVLLLKSGNDVTQNMVNNFNLFNKM